MIHPPTTRVCLQCGEPDDQGAPGCWSCQRRKRRRSSRPPIASSLARPTRHPLKTIKGWMIVVAVTAVAAAILRPSHEQLLYISCVLVLSPAVWITEIRAKRRRNQGLPMSVWERVVSVSQLTAGIVCLLILAGLLVSFIMSHR